MNVTDTMKVMRRALTDNSTSVLTGLAVAGVITTAVMAVRATPKAILQIGDAQELRTMEVLEQNRLGEVLLHSEELSSFEIVKVTWTGYIPAAAFGATTIACIIGANTIASKKSAALMGAYSVAETALKEYQSKVVETLGDKTDQKIRDSVAKDQLEKNPPNSTEVHILGPGETLCYDSLSGRYFNGDMEKIRKAQNDINAQVIGHQYASMNEFYYLIGLEQNTFGETTGWRPDHLMELVFSTHLSEDGRPCLSIGYREQPIVNYWKEY